MLTIKERTIIPCSVPIWKDPMEGARSTEPGILGLPPASDSSGAPLPLMASNIAAGLGRFTGSDVVLRGME